MVDEHGNIFNQYGQLVGRMDAVTKATSNDCVQTNTLVEIVEQLKRENEYLKGLVEDYKKEWEKSSRIRYECINNAEQISRVVYQMYILQHGLDRSVATPCASADEKR